MSEKNWQDRLAECDIRGALNTYLESAERRPSWRDLERSTGINYSRLLQWSKGTYRGKTDDIEAAVRAYLELIADRAAENVEENIPYQMITSAKNAQAVFRFAHLEREMALVVGEPGVGKTRAIMEYKRRNKNTIVIEIEPGICNVTRLLGKFCAELGIQTGSAAAMFDAIVSKLRGSDRLIIVDEGEYLTFIPIEILRRIHDFSGVGLVLVGREMLYHTITGTRFQHDQVYSRIGRYYRMEKPSEPEEYRIIRAIIPAADDIRCAAICDESRGRIRRLIKLCKRLKAVASGNKIEVNGIPPETIKDIAEKQLI